MKNKSYSLLKNSITCFVTIGLLNSILFSTGCVSAQSQSDNLYNPFLLENADYPYKPVGCVVIPSRFDRLRSHEVMDVFQKTFADAGIKLEEKVCLEKDNPGVYLSGYSEEDEIGFVLINRWNMDDSFREGNSSNNYEKRGEGRLFLKEEMKIYEESRERTFQTFMQNKEGFL